MRPTSTFFIIQLSNSRVPAPANHHRGSYTSPALATASYPFVDLPPGNTLRRKLFPSSKFYNRPLYFSETMRYNEVNDKLELNKIAARWPAKAVA